MTEIFSTFEAFVFRALKLFGDVVKGLMNFVFTILIAVFVFGGTIATTIAAIAGGTIATTIAATIAATEAAAIAGVAIATIAAVGWGTITTISAVASSVTVARAVTTVDFRDTVDTGVSGSSYFLLSFKLNSVDAAGSKDSSSQNFERLHILFYLNDI